MTEENTSGPRVSVVEQGGLVSARTKEGDFEISVVLNTNFPGGQAEVMFRKGEEEFTIGLPAESMGGDKGTQVSSAEEAALKFGALIKKGLSPQQIQEVMDDEAMGRVDQ
jgi:GGDEF domain-containing protein